VIFWDITNSVARRSPFCELQAPVKQAGLGNFQIHRYQWFFRLALEGKNEPPDK
jgi:hypothetical protein